MRSIISATRKALAQALSGRILDIGCGEDMFGPLLRRGGNRVISVDIDLEQLRKIPCRGVVASCADMPFPDDYFDAVWACAIVEHVAEDTIPEMVRVTRPGGRIIVVTPNRRSPWDPLKRLTGLTVWAENEGHVRLYSSEELAVFGPVHGEVVFLPIDAARRFFWNHPNVAHALIADIRATDELKAAVRRDFPRLFDKQYPPYVRIC